jgi:multidrug resistance efflux pump
MTSELDPIPTPPEQRAEDFRQRKLPMLVWGFSLLVCGFLLFGRAHRFEYIGLARGLQYNVSAVATGSLESLAVELYDEVQAEQVLARLDDSALSARYDRSQAAIRRLEAELNAARIQFASSSRQERSGFSSDLRRFQTDEEERRRAAQELRVTLESDKVLLTGLSLDLERSEPLLSSGLIGRFEYDQTKASHDELARRIEENQVLLTQTEGELRAAEARRRSFEQSLPTRPQEEPILLPLREAISEEMERLREIEAERGALVLRSPVSGQVTSILCRRGETVVAGEPVLTVAERSVKDIVAYLSESESRNVLERTPVRISALRDPGRVAESVVVQVGASLELMPERLWTRTGTPQYGRAVVIAAIPALELAPGELLNVRFDD